MTPNAYIFTLDNGKFVVVEAPWGHFHSAYLGAFQHLAGEHEIVESHEWKPDPVSQQIMLSNQTGELYAHLRMGDGE